MERCKLCGLEVVSTALHNFNCSKLKEAMADIETDWEPIDEFVEAANRQIAKTLEESRKANDPGSANRKGTGAYTRRRKLR